MTPPEAGPEPSGLGPRSAAALGLVGAVGVVAFGWPLFAARLRRSPRTRRTRPGSSRGCWSLLVAVVVATISESGLGPKAVAMLGVLAAAGRRAAPARRRDGRASSRCSS